MTADTIVPDPGNAQSFNRYSYVLNSPIRYTDPTGHAAEGDCVGADCETDTETGTETVTDSDIDNWVNSLFSPPEDEEQEENMKEPDIPCPKSPPPEDDPNLKPYTGNPDWFHCGYKGFKDKSDPQETGMKQQECFYDEDGKLVDDNHPHSGCKGTPNEFDSKTDTWDHIWNDSGGVRQSGWDAFTESRSHDAKNSDLPVVLYSQRFIPIDQRHHKRVFTEKKGYKKVFIQRPLLAFRIL